MRGWIAIFVLCTLCGCQALHVNDILTEAERQLSDAPDSALVTLQSVKRHALLRPKVRARYGLLYSAVLDKNFVDVASDSLIRYSASYYDAHGTAEERGGLFDALIGSAIVMMLEVIVILLINRCFPYLLRIPSIKRRKNTI